MAAQMKHKDLIISGYIRVMDKKLYDTIPSDINQLCILYFNDCTCFIKVFCRIRPISNMIHQTKSTLCLRKDNSIEIKNHNNKLLHFKTFDKLYGGETDNNEIAKDLITYSDNVLLKGSTVTLCAFGAHPAGKTHTIMGNKQDPGIAHRCIQYMFDTIEQQKHGNFVIKCAIFEIYNEKLKDLICATDDSSDSYLDIKNDDDDVDDLMSSQDLSWIELNCVNDYCKLHDICKKRRHQRPSAFNNSFENRSHVFIVFRVYRNKTKFGEMWLIDLCGSQRVRKVNQPSYILKECQSVGKSLGSFMNVLCAVQKREKFIPYKNSVLTMLLKRNLSNNKYVIVYINVYENAFYDAETISSLRFGQRISFNFCKEKKQSMKNRM